MSNETKPQKPNANVNQNSNANSNSNSNANTSVYDHKDWLLELMRKHEDLYEFVSSNKQPQAGGIVRRVMQHLVQDIRHLQVVTGVVVDMSGSNASSLVGAGAVENPLLNTTPKSLFGISIDKGRKPIKSDNFTPKKNEVDNFKSEVENLYKAFLGLKDRDIEDLSAKPNGETLIRGVAKKAGLKNWESGDIDIYLYANIRESITNNGKNKATVQAFSNEMNEMNELNENE